MKGGKVSWPGSTCERGWNEGRVLLSGETAVLPGVILWSGPAGAAAGGKREDVFFWKSGAPGAGARRIPGGCFTEVEPRRGERSEREGRPGGHPEAAAGEPLGARLLADPLIYGRGLVDLVGLRGPVPAPGDPGGCCFRRGRLPRLWEALDKEKGSAAPPAGVVRKAILENVIIIIIWT